MQSPQADRGRVGGGWFFLKHDLGGLEDKEGPIMLCGMTWECGVKRE